MNFRRVEYKLINRDNGTSIILNDTSPGGTFYAPPLNYDESETTILRDLETFGVFTQISKSFDFVKEGANFLRLAYDSRDIEAVVDLIEYRFNPNTDVKYTYLTGTLDFSDYVSTTTNVSISMRSGGLNTLIDSKKKEKYELDRETSINGNPISPIEINTVGLTSRDILLISELETKEQDTSTESFRLVESFVDAEGHVGIPLSINYESDDMVTSQINNQFTDSNTSGLGSMVFYLNNDIDKDIDVSISLSFTPEYVDIFNFEDLFFKVIIETYNNGLNLDIDETKRRELFSVDGDQNVIDYFFNEDETVINFSETINLLQGESLSLQWYGGGDPVLTGAYSVNFKNNVCKVNIDEDSIRPNSQSQVALMNDVGSQITKILTGEEGKYESDFF